MKDNYTKNVLFDEEQYLSKNQLSKQFDSTIVVNQKWKKIVAEREQFKNYLNILNGIRNKYYYVNNNHISNKIKNSDSILEEINNLLIGIDNDSVLHKLQDEIVLNNFKCLNNSVNAGWNNNTISAISMGKYDRTDIRSEDETLLRFYDLYTNLIDSDLIEANKQFVEKAYNLIEFGEDKGVSYRTTDFDKQAYIARNTNEIPPYAAAITIDDLMDELFEFLDNETSTFLRVSTVLYYVNYVKPFNKHNELISVLLACATAWKDMDKNAFLIPTPLLLNYKNIKIKDAYIDTMTSNDMSYVYDRLGSIIDTEFRSTLNDYVRFKENLIKDFGTERSSFIYVESETNDVIQDEIVNQNRLDGEINDEFLDNDDEEQQIGSIKQEFNEELDSSIIEKTIEKQEEDKDISSETIEEENPKSPDVQNRVVEKVVYRKVVVPVIPKKTVMSKERIKEYTQYLLERYPLLNKKQASYVANHMEPGLYYDINSFKKFNKCAYETARTSMDKLAEMGFYEKQQVKNKYVYTPTIGQNQGE